MYIRQSIITEIPPRRDTHQMRVVLLPYASQQSIRAVQCMLLVSFTLVAVIFSENNMPSSKYVEQDTDAFKVRKKHWYERRT